VADIFVSYTSSDRDWAFWIGHELEALGHVPHIHDWEIPAGGDIMKWMEERHRAADHILCVVSSAYLDTPYSSLERRAAQWAAVDKRPNFAIPIFIEPCEVPTLFAPLKRCDLHGLSEKDARARLRAFLAPAAKPPPGPFPGAVKTSPQPPSGNPPAFPGKTALSNIPIRVPLHFTGRDDALDAIEMALKRYEGRAAITALHGLRGVGKTTLAAAYAERHRGDYRATWWIRAQAETTIRADLVALGIRLDWVAADAKEQTAVDTVMERLRREGEGILLIFDNAIHADALEPHLPRGGNANVLITSNAPAWRGVGAPVEIRLWPKDIGGDYLIARTGRTSERAAAEVLSEVLGGLPLAHEQAAAYCERLDISLAAYRSRFDRTPVRLLDDARHAPAGYHDGLTVAKTFALAIDEAAKLHQAAEPLIAHAALLAPEPIPLFLFSEAWEKFGEPLATALTGDGLDEAVAVLRGFALVDRETIVDERDASITTDAIRLHRLVREIAAVRRQDEARDDMRSAQLAALAQIYPRDGHNNPASWPRCAVLTPHVLAMEKADLTSNADWVELLNSVGGYFRVHAAYSEAKRLFESALAICEKVLGPKHPDTATNLNDLALLLRDQGDLARARPLLERALAIYEEVLGPEHPYTATSLQNLAALLHNQRDLAGARPLKERALEIRMKVLGPQHPDTAVSLNDLGWLLSDQGDLPAAKTLFGRALTIFEAVFGPEHPEGANTLSNIASLLAAQGDSVAARAAFERALAIREKMLGPEHPKTGTSLNNLALQLMEQGDLAGARPLLERALAIGQKVLGPEHPDVAKGLSNLARLLNKAGHASDAEPLFLKAITIDEKALGRDHQLTQRHLSHYARLLLDTARTAEALPLAQTALATHETASGANHPWTKDSARVTADALAALGRADEAAALRARHGLSDDGR
jgi:tetratricopeptide (TPR) repeat protein